MSSRVPSPWDDLDADPPPSLSGAAERQRRAHDDNPPSREYPPPVGGWQEDERHAPRPRLSHPADVNDLGEPPMHSRAARPREHVVYTGHPSWRGMLGFYIKWFMVISLLTAFGWGFHMLGAFSWIWVVLGAIAGYSALWGIGKLIRTSTIYEVTNRKVMKRWGIVYKHQEEASLRRIQNISIQVSLVDRLLKVGAIDFDTAGSQEDRNNMLRFWGISEPFRVRALIRLDDDADADIY